MVIDQKKLKTGLALGLLGLYAFGIGCTFTYKTNGEYIRYLNNEYTRLKREYVQDKRVVDEYNSVKFDDTSYTDRDGVELVPYISYIMGYNSNTNYANGEVHFCLQNKTSVNNNYDDVYLDFTGHFSDIVYHNTDVGDFVYNNLSYTPIDFLTNIDSNGIYSYDTLYQYGYSGSFVYSQGDIIVTFNFDFKTPQSLTWTSVVLFTHNYFNDFMDDDFSYSFTNRVYNNYDLVNSLNYANASINGFSQGVADVLNNPQQYGLYTLDEYLRYGTAQYNQGLEDGSNVLSMSGVMNSIFSAPITMFMQIFNSAPFTWTMPTGEVLDIGGIMTFFLTIGIALAIVRLIMKVGGK